jgi:hypothetical protein
LSVELAEILTAAGIMVKSCGHWTPRGWIGSKWNDYRRSYRDFPQIKRGKSCSQFPHTLTNRRRHVKPDF